MANKPKSFDVLHTYYSDDYNVWYRIQCYNGFGLWIDNHDSKFRKDVPFEEDERWISASLMELIKGKGIQ